MNTFSCISDFAVGGVLAYYTFVRAAWVDKINNLSKGWVILIYSFGISLFLIRSFGADYEYVYHNECLLFSVFFAFVILEQNSSTNSILKLGKFKTISTLGKYTYGLYMYHFVAVYIISMLLDKLQFNDKLYQVIIIEPILALGLSIAISFFSYHLFEQRLPKLKDRFSNTIIREQ